MRPFLYPIDNLSQMLRVCGAARRERVTAGAPRRSTAMGMAAWRGREPATTGAPHGPQRRGQSHAVSLTLHTEENPITRPPNLFLCPNKLISTQETLHSPNLRYEHTTVVLTYQPPPRSPHFVSVGASYVFDGRGECVAVAVVVVVAVVAAVVVAVAGREVFER